MKIASKAGEPCHVHALDSRSKHARDDSDRAHNDSAAVRCFAAAVAGGQQGQEEGEDDVAARPGRLSRRGFLATGAVAGASTWGLAGSAAVATAASKKPAGRRPKRRAPARLPAPAPIHARAANPADLGVLEAASLLQAGLLSSREITEACQARIAARNGPVTFDGSPTTVNAWIRLYPDLAHELAAAADTVLTRARRTRTEAPLLCGVPLALKDLYAVKGLPVTASSHVLDGNIAPGDSTAWARLKAAGMVLLGHAHTHEFALGVMTPQCGNPWSLAKSVGGSSGGSAAALATRMVPAATGTDTGGSLRSPPSATGVCALKPTFGLVSAHGVIPIGWSIDHAGPMARSAGDLGLLLSSLAGPDPADSASLAAAARPPFYPTLPRTGAQPLRGLRIGVPDGAAGGLPAPLATLFGRAQDELRTLGATIVPFTEPDKSSVEFTLDDLGASGVEAGIYHRQFAPKAASYGPSVGALVMALVAAVNAIPATAYVELQRHRTDYIHAWNAVFAAQRLDAILKPGANVDGADRTGAAALVATGGVTGDFVWADVAGLPVLAMPAGQSAATGLPFGVQLGGAPYSEATLLQIGIDYQAHTTHHQDTPPGLR
jgi:aspartyl-tRNA(Asn)/glutamyl-tRNA(Gln) amidotransferase subunit A